MSGAFTARTIVVADDEPAVRAYVRNILLPQGVHLIEATDGLDAMEKIELQNLRVDLLISDVRMPRMDGLALARSLARAGPSIPIIFISGYPFDLEGNTTDPKLACVVLSKPFTRQALLSAIEKCLPLRDNLAGNSL